MNYFDRVQKAVDYIEVSITEELSLEDIARQDFELYDERCMWDKPETDIYIPIR